MQVKCCFGLETRVIKIDPSLLHCKCLQGFTRTLRGVFCNICRENPVSFIDCRGIAGKIYKYYRVFPVNPCKHLQCTLQILTDFFLTSSQWKSANIYKVKRWVENFDDYSGFQTKKNAAKNTCDSRILVEKCSIFNPHWFSFKGVWALAKRGLRYFGQIFLWNWLTQQKDWECWVKLRQ